MSSGKLEGAGRFRHFLWRHHSRPAWQNYLPEIVATDGRVVRRMVSRDKQIVFQIFEDDGMAMSIVNAIESSVEVGDALLGYSLYADEETVAILRTGVGDGPGWLAIPRSHVATQEARFPTLPLRVASAPQLRVVGGANIRQSAAGYEVVAAVEQRGSAFAASEFAFELLRHVANWEIRATVEKEGEIKSIRLLRDPVAKFSRTAGNRIEASSPVDSWIYREYHDDPSLKLWFVLRFDTDLFCLPDQWMTFWLHAERMET